MNTIYNEIIRNLSSDTILKVQKELMDLGYSCLDTGEWDYLTNNAFEKFKNMHCLDIEGALSELSKMYNDGAVE